MQSFQDSGILSAAQEAVTCPCAGFGGVAVQVASGLTGTITFEGTVDGVNWAAMIMTPIGTTVGVTSTTAAGLWRGCVVGLVAFRARCSAFTSDSAYVTVKLSESSPTLINITGP